MKPSTPPLPSPLRSATTQPPRQPAARPAPPRGRLLTETEVLAALRDEIAASSLVATARRYRLKPQQISDVLYGRANLSPRMVARLSLRMHKFYERLDGPGAAAGK